MHLQAAPHDFVRWYYGTAEHIPLADDSVDGVLCILASHHFSSLETAVIEMARICARGPIVWLTFDPRLAETPWLRDYFPGIWESAFEVFPPLEDVSHLLENHARRDVTATPWPVPHDLQDCFMAAGWRTPETYLDPEFGHACQLARPIRHGDGLFRWSMNQEQWMEKQVFTLLARAMTGIRFAVQKTVNKAFHRMLTPPVGFMRREEDKMKITNNTILITGAVRVSVCLCKSVRHDIQSSYADVTRRNLKHYISKILPSLPLFAISLTTRNNSP
jgi:SAM-dependent methyltransferase